MVMEAKKYQLFSDIQQSLTFTIGKLRIMDDKQV